MILWQILDVRVGYDASKLSVYHAGSTKKVWIKNWKSNEKVGIIDEKSRDSRAIQRMSH